MLIVDGDADAAVETRIRIGCNKFRQSLPHTHTHTHTQSFYGPLGFCPGPPG